MLSDYQSDEQMQDNFRQISSKEDKMPCLTTSDHQIDMFPYLLFVGRDHPSRAVYDTIVYM
jgi:hypothetical protein